MKIGIITLTGYFNYGNRLQNYALQQILKSLNLDIKVETIEVVEKKEKNIKQKIISKIDYVINSNYFPDLKLKKIQNRKRMYKKNILDDERMSNIYNWSIKNIQNHIVKIEDGVIPGELNNNFDYFIVGSDQVWNPYFNKYLSPYFLNFANKEKRISYAASFGISDIPEDKIKDYKKWISGMNSISVREHVGKKIVENLTDKEAQVVIDPTMLLDKNQWLQVIEMPKNMPKEKYILTYLLGEKSKQYEEFINRLKNERNLKVINILDLNNEDIYCVDPGEFVYLINHAEVMITDSFHGAVFSILMKTPFVIFERQDAHVSMNSRIDTLVTTFRMESRLSSQITSIDDVFNIDFTHIDEILKYEREKSIRYLKNAFSIE